MTSLVTLDVLKDRLRADEAAADSDIARIGEEASAIVVDYLKIKSPAWTPETVPPVVRAAILMVAQNMDAGEPQPLSRGVKDILRRLRNPALA